MSKRKHREYSDRQLLRENGWDVSKVDSIQFNGTSETFDHLICKAAAGYYLKQHGYRVDSEVEMPHGEVDILGYANEGRNPIIVEIERKATDDVLSDKMERYVFNQPVREMFVVDPLDLEDTLNSPLLLVDEAIGWGLEP